MRVVLTRQIETQTERDDESALLAMGWQGGLLLRLISLDNLAKLILEEQVRPREETIRRTYCAVFVDYVDREYEELKRKGVNFVKPPRVSRGASG